MSEWVSVEANQRYAVNRSGEIKNLETGRILKPIKSKSGYLVADLYDQNTHKKKRHRIHRLVAMAFLSNPLEKEDVNHKDGNRQNNVLSNLEWVTRSENNYHKCRVLGNKPNPPTKPKPVLCVDTNEIFASRTDAAKAHKTQPVHINECCAGRRKTAGGYRWADVPPEPPKEDDA